MGVEGAVAADRPLMCDARVQRQQRRKGGEKYVAAREGEEPRMNADDTDDAREREEPQGREVHAGMWTLKGD